MAGGCPSGRSGGGGQERQGGAGRVRGGGRPPGGEPHRRLHASPFQPLTVTTIGTCFSPELPPGTPKVDTDLDTKRREQPGQGGLGGQAEHKVPGQRHKTTKPPTPRTVPVILRC